MRNRLVNDKAVSALIWEVDAKGSETNCLISKTPEYYYLINLDARNIFSAGVGAGTLKYMISYNHCGHRDKKSIII